MNMNSLKNSNIRNLKILENALPVGHMHLKANSVRITSREKEPLSTKSPLKR